MTRKGRATTETGLVNGSEPVQKLSWGREEEGKEVGEGGGRGGRERRRGGGGNGQLAADGGWGVGGVFMEKLFLFWFWFCFPVSRFEDLGSLNCLDELWGETNAKTKLFFPFISSATSSF